MDLSEEHRRSYDSYYRALNAYAPSRLSKPLTLVLTEDWQANPTWPARLERWKTVALGGIDIKFLSGTHGGVLHMPAVGTLSALVTAVMESTESVMAGKTADQ